LSTQKYFPPDFDPSKIKRRKGLKKQNGSQMTVRLMSPYSMRCSKCGEYIYKGKKFNARKETAVGEEYLGIKVFRFYIKCPVCSSEITFKTDPKQGDFVPEHGATRNFENWKETDPNNQAGLLPSAEADLDYDSDGNPTAEKVERDAMADLERSQEQSRREMEIMDELADLRQRNARVETSARADDPESLLAALHAERENAEEAARRQAEDDEDDAMVAKYFTKLPPPGAKVDAGPSGAGDASDDEGSDSPAPAPAPMIVKRAAAAAKGEPTVSSLLAAKGKAVEAAPPKPAVKRKRGDLQKALGIKGKKAKA
jgi:rubredoxin